MYTHAGTRPRAPSERCLCWHLPQLCDMMFLVPECSFVHTSIQPFVLILHSPSPTCRVLRLAQGSHNFSIAVWASRRSTSLLLCVSCLGACTYVRLHDYWYSSCSILWRTAGHRDSRCFVGMFHGCMVVFILMMLISLWGSAGMYVLVWHKVGLVIDVPPCAVRSTAWQVKHEVRAVEPNSSKSELTLVTLGVSYVWVDPFA